MTEIFYATQLAYAAVMAAFLALTLILGRLIARVVPARRRR